MEISKICFLQSYCGRTSIRVKKHLKKPNIAIDMITKTWKMIDPSLTLQCWFLTRSKIDLWPNNDQKSQIWLYRQNTKSEIYKHLTCAQSTQRGYFDKVDTPLGA